MTVASIMIELNAGVDEDTVKSNVKAKLESAPEVERAVVDDYANRFDVASAVAMLAAAVVLVDQGTKLLESITKLVKTTRQLLEEGNSLKSAVIEISGIKIDPKSDDAEIEAAVRKITKDLKTQDT